MKSSQAELYLPELNYTTDAQLDSTIVYLEVNPNVCLNKDYSKEKSVYCITASCYFSCRSPWRPFEWDLVFPTRKFSASSSQNYHF